MLKESIVSPVIITDDIQRSIRLNQLGIPENIILDISRNAVTYKTDSTEFDTKPGPGVAQWNSMVKGLRTQMCTKGWTKYEVKGIEGIKSIQKNLVILPISGNAATGNPKQPAGIKRKRGDAGIKLLDRCCQLPLFEDYTDNFFEEVKEIYVLLYYNNSTELRIELSKPSYISLGMIKAWEERIIFPVQELITPAMGIVETSVNDEYEILITTRENMG